MKNEQTTAIALPLKTRETVRTLVAERATLQALLEQNDRSINNMLEAAREMLGVPEGWEITNTAVGFVAPKATTGTPAPPVE